MAGEIENFGNKRGLNNFATNKQNINRKGRPKKGVSFVNDELLKMGYKPITKADFEATYKQMGQLEKPILTELMKDDTKPIFINKMAEGLINGDGIDVFETIFSRIFGKPIQETKNLNIDKKIDPVENSDQIDDLLDKSGIKNDTKGNITK